MFSWFQFLSYCFAILYSPGPNVILSMSTAGQRGLRGTLPLIAGIYAGFNIVSLLSTLFCSTLSALIPKIKLPMLIVGAAYILYLAWKIFRRSSVIEDNGREASFSAGFIMQFLNPKVYLCCIVAMQAYILPYYEGQWTALIPFALLIPILALFSNLLWATFGSVLKLLFAKHAKLINTVMALLLVYCAVAMFL